MNNIIFQQGSWATQIGSGNVCRGDFHVYPLTYAGDPQYAAEYFSRCLCGQKKKVTTVTEVDVSPIAVDYPVTEDRSNTLC